MRFDHFTLTGKKREDMGNGEEKSETEEQG